MAVKRKQRRKPAKKRSSNKTKNIIIPLAVLIAILLVMFGFHLAQLSLNKESVKQKPSKTHRPSQDIVRSQKSIVSEDPHRLNRVKKEVPAIDQKEPEKKEEPKQERKNIITYKDAPVIVVKKEPLITGKKVKLVIIIDDVYLQRQIDNIKATGLKITPSIFPPSKISKESYKLAYALDHYMVHLPLESSSVQMNKMQGTLMVADSPEKILRKVGEVKRLFPKVKYINNHTGSVYTSNYQAMKILYALLKQEGITFVDSRTDTHTQVPRVTKDLHERYISRDVFLDNVRDVKSIRTQLKEAVRIAKKQGYAIAIGHPYDVTIRTLSSSKDILQGVDVVYIDELFGG